MLRSSSICASFLYNYLKGDGDSKDENGNTYDKKCQQLRCLSKTLENYGGVLSKLAQILSLNNQSSSVFSDCKPFSKEKTTEYFKENCPKEVTNVNYNVYKSGSVGQVYKATYKKNKVIFKVRYVGILEQTVTDLKMLDMITSYVYSFSDVKAAMTSIKVKMNEELDYKLEASNQKLLYKIWKDSEFIQIPKIIKKLCTDFMICMQFVKGRCLREFIETSTQDERNSIGMYIFRFVFENIYKHYILYSDVHYGNFLVKENGMLCVLDFGCIHRIDKTLVENLKKIHKSIVNQDKDAFYSVVESMGIMNKNIKPESKQYMYDYFLLQYTPWIVDEFEFTDEWLDRATDKNTDLMKDWGLPQNMVYFNKIPYGAYHIFTKLKLKGNFKQVFDTLI